MRSLLVVGITLLLVVSVLVAPAAPRGPQAIRFNDTGSTDLLTCNIDHQGTWPDGDPAGFVHNPTACGDDLPEKDLCAWGDQDSRMRTSSGYVEGAWTDRTCLFADLDSGGVGNFPKSVYVNVYAADDSLRVELSNNASAVSSHPDDHWVAGPSIAAGNLRKWRICVIDPVADRADVRPQYDPSLYWPLVEFSNGGYAQRVDYTLTLTALGRRARDVTARLEVAGTGPTWAAPRSITDCP